MKTIKNAYPILISSVNLKMKTINIKAQFNNANTPNPPIIKILLPTLSIAKVPTRFPNSPENDAIQFAIAALDSVNPMP